MAKTNPETIIQSAIMRMLTRKGWLVKRMGASQYLVGFPDLFAYHQVYKTRLIEVKTSTGKLEKSQIKEFTRFAKYDCGVWVLKGASQEEYNKLFAPANWWTYLPGNRGWEK